VTELWAQPLPSRGSCGCIPQLRVHPLVACCPVFGRVRTAENPSGGRLSPNNLAFPVWATAASTMGLTSPSEALSMRFSDGTIGWKRNGFATPSTGPRASQQSPLLVLPGDYRDRAQRVVVPQSNVV